MANDNTLLPPPPAPGVESGAFQGAATPLPAAYAARGVVQGAQGAVQPPPAPGPVQGGPNQVIPTPAPTPTQQPTPSDEEPTKIEPGGGARLGQRIATQFQQDTNAPPEEQYHQNAPQQPPQLGAQDPDANLLGSQDPDVVDPNRQAQLNNLTTDQIIQGSDNGSISRPEAITAFQAALDRERNAPVNPSQIAKDITSTGFDVARGFGYGVSPHNVKKGLAGMFDTTGKMMDTFVDALGASNKDATAWDAQLAAHEKQLLDTGVIDQVEYAKRMALWQQANDISKRLESNPSEMSIPMGVTGVPMGDPDAIRSLQLQKANLVNQIDPEFAQNRAQQAMREFIAGGHLWGDNLKMWAQNMFGDQASQKLENWLHTRLGLPQGNNFDSPDKIGDFLDQHRTLYQDQQNAKIGVVNPQAESNIQAFSGALGQKYQSGQQLSAENMAAQPEKIAQTAGGLQNVFQTAQMLAPLPGLEELGLPALGLSSKIARLTGKAAGAVLGAERPFAAWEIGGSIMDAFKRVGTGYLQAGMPGATAALPGAAWEAGSRIGTMALPWLIKNGSEFAANRLENAFKNNYNGEAFWKQMIDRGLRSTTEAIPQSMLYAGLNSDSPYSYGANLGNMALLHGLTHGVKDLGLSALGSTGDSIIVTDPKQVDKPVPMNPYGVYSPWDKINSAEYDMLTPKQQGRYSRVRQLQRSYVDYYLQPQADLTNTAQLLGANHVPGTPGFAIPADLNPLQTGRSMVFLDPYHFDTVLSHEGGHPAFWTMDPDMQADTVKWAKQINDPNQFTKNYFKNTPWAGATYDDLPKYDDVITGRAQPHPSGYTKEVMDSELGAETLGPLFNGKTMNDIAANASPPLRYKISLAMANVLNRLGMPSTTAEARSILGVQPALTVAGLHWDWLHNYLNRRITTPQDSTGTIPGRAQPPGAQGPTAPGGAPPGGTPPGGAPPGGAKAPSGMPFSGTTTPTPGPGIKIKPANVLRVWTPNAPVTPGTTPQLAAPGTSGTGATMPPGEEEQQIPQLTGTIKEETPVPQALPVEKGTTETAPEEQKIPPIPTPEGPTTTEVMPQPTVHGASAHPEVNQKPAPQGSDEFHATLRQNVRNGLSTGESQAIQTGRPVVPSQKDSSDNQVTATEFGHIDEAAARAHPERYPSGNRGYGPFGQVDLNNANQDGVSVPPEDIVKHFGNVLHQDAQGVWHADPNFAEAVRNHRIMVQVTNPANGRTSTVPLVDIGPKKSTGNGLDILYKTSRDLGFESGKAPMNYHFTAGTNALNVPAGTNIHGTPFASPRNIAAAAEANVGRLNTTEDPGTSGGALACVDAVTRIVHDQLGINLPRTLSTEELNNNMRNGGWLEVNPHTPGAVIVSPSKGSTHGHAGIVGSDGDSIYSNNSRDGTWGRNYTVESWDKELRAGRGLETHAYVPGPNVGAYTSGGTGVPTGGGFAVVPPIGQQQQQEGAAAAGGGGPEQAVTPAGEITAPRTGGTEAAEQTGYYPNQAAVTGGISYPPYMGAGGGPPEAPGPMPQIPGISAEAPYMPQGGGGNIGAYMPPTGPGAAGGRQFGGIRPEGPEGQEPELSTLGIGNVANRQIGPLLDQGTPASLKEAAKQHASLLSEDDTRVKRQADGYIKGEHFQQGDDFHKELLNNMPDNERNVLAQAQGALADRRMMHTTYASAPTAALTEHPTAGTRDIEYEMSSPQARLLKGTKAQLAGHSFIPTSIGVKPAQKAGQPHEGYIQGVSTNVAENNVHHINNALAEMGQNSPYPRVNTKFANDLEGYVSNLNAGYMGTGEGPQPGTEKHPLSVDPHHTPYKLSRREADFLNAVVNNQGARAKTPEGEAIRELARKGERLLTEQGETNPFRNAIDAHQADIRGRLAAEHPENPELQKKARSRWSEDVLEPSIRTFKAGLVHDIHEREEDMPEGIRPGREYQQLSESMERQMPRGRPDIPMAAAFMPPLTKAEHSELTGNIRKQWISGKIRTPEYKERMAEVPQPGEPIRHEPVEKAPEPSEEREPSAPSGPIAAFMTKLEKPKNWETQPEKVRQAYLKQKVAQTMAKQWTGPDAHPLKVQRNEDGSIQYNPSGNPIYQKVDYNIVNSPLLGKKGLDKIATEDAKEHEDTVNQQSEFNPEGKAQHEYLNGAERRRLSALRNSSAVNTMADRIVSSFDKIKNQPDIMAGKGWYSRMRERLNKIFGGDHEIFAQLLGATSAKTPVRTNFINALDALEQYRAGKAGQSEEEWQQGLKDGTNHHLGFNRHIAKYQEAYDKMQEGDGALGQYMKSQGIQPLDKNGNKINDWDSDEAALGQWIAHHGILPKTKTGTNYSQNSNAVLKVLAGTWLKEVGAPKTPNFAGNLTGRTLEATIDVWAARHLQRLGYEGLTGNKPWRPQAASETGVSAMDFAFSQDAMRRATEKLREKGVDMNPDDLQAILWFAEKDHYHKKGWTRGQGAEKSSFDSVADLAFPKSGEPMNSTELRSHYQAQAKAKAARAGKIKTAKGYVEKGQHEKLAPYMQKHGLTHAEVHGAPEEEEEEEAA